MESPEISRNRRSELATLTAENGHTEPISCAGRDSALLFKFLEDMLRIRVVEEEIGVLVERGVARAPCHLGIGQEAIAVGVSASLTPEDRVFGGHRSHSHYLALGGDTYALVAEVLGKEDGASRGMGGSMHLYAPEAGFMGSVPLVGATIPIAVGAGLAAKLDGSGAVAVSYFGDGATEEGVFHESLNLAANYVLPVLFVCENNLYSSHLDIQLRQPSDRIARFAEAHRIESASVDGNDVLNVAETAHRFISGIRAGAGPAFLEAVTYRHRGHVGPKADIDVGVRRSRRELEAWKRKDPIRRLAAGMAKIGLISEAQLVERTGVIRKDVRDIVQRAEAATYPPASALLSRVFVQSGD